MRHGDLKDERGTEGGTICRQQLGHLPPLGLNCAVKGSQDLSIQQDSLKVIQSRKESLPVKLSGKVLGRFLGSAVKPKVLGKLQSNEPPHEGPRTPGPQCYEQAPCFL